MFVTTIQRQRAQLTRLQGFTLFKAFKHHRSKRQGQRAGRRIFKLHRQFGHFEPGEAEPRAVFVQIPKAVLTAEQVCDLARQSFRRFDQAQNVSAQFAVRRFDHGVLQFQGGEKGLVFQPLRTGQNQFARRQAAIFQRHGEICEDVGAAFKPAFGPAGATLLLEPEIGQRGLGLGFADGARTRFSAVALTRLGSAGREAQSQSEHDSERGAAGL